MTTPQLPQDALDMLHCAVQVGGASRAVHDALMQLYHALAMQEPIKEGAYSTFRARSEALKQVLAATDQIVAAFFQARQGREQDA
jgi:hypothetical protein